MAEQKILARDRETGKVGAYTEEFLRAWPAGYRRLTDTEVAEYRKRSKAASGRRATDPDAASEPSAGDTTPSTGDDTKGAAS